MPGANQIIGSLRPRRRGRAERASQGQSPTRGAPDLGDEAVVEDVGDAGAEAAEDGQGGDRVPPDVDRLEPGEREHDGQEDGGGGELAPLCD
jgi:hypothetical protein